MFSTLAQHVVTAPHEENVARKAQGLEIASDSKGQPKRTSPVREFTDIFELPIVAANAFLRNDVPGDWTGDLPKVGKALSGRRPDFSALANEYGAGSPGELKYSREHGSVLGKYRSEHPLANAG
ncbi:MAG: hypothetical protein ACREML_13715, partial [Vulcanimicrobiaceae bacterium]